MVKKSQKKTFTKQQMAKILDEMSEEEKLALRAIKKNKEDMLNNFDISESEEFSESFLEE